MSEESAPINRWKKIVNLLVKENKFLEHPQTDLVLVYKVDDDRDANEFRRKFFSWVESVDINVRETKLDEEMIVELNVPLYLLCLEGSRAGIKVATQYISAYKGVLRADFSRLCFCLRCFQNDNFVDKLSVSLDDQNIRYVDFDSPYIFRLSTRSLLTYYILNSNDMFEETSKERGKMSLGYNEGLNFMLDRGYFKAAFPLHEELKVTTAENVPVQPVLVSRTEEKDIRKELLKAWRKTFKFQPVNMIRNYFGEQIALYFAWCDILILSLWIPMIFGVVTFIYGYINYTKKNDHSLTSSRNVTYINVISGSFDNELMPVYAVVVTLWGTLFLELWKRQNARLAYLWDVKSFEDKEPDRPQYKKIPNIICRGYWLRFFISSLISLFMVCLVFGITGALVVYRVVMKVDYCKNHNSLKCTIVSEVVSSILNTIGIMALRTIYSKVALALTKWENYRTRTEFNDALVAKTFAFEFANSYTSCFYIAFFRMHYEEGLFGLGSNYNDVCRNSENMSCMPVLSMQILTLMVSRPLTKALADIILPYLMKKIRAHSKARVSDKNSSIPSHVEREYAKEPLRDFTMEEYTEKVVLYGYLMMFAASFPLAPLVAMVAMRIDIRIDSRRLLYIYRRPIPFIAEDIGSWFDILNFMNAIGVMVNAFLIAFTSRFGERLSFAQKLIFVILFENVVYAIKYLVAIIIPDIPNSVKRAKRMDNFKSVEITSKMSAVDKTKVSRIILQENAKEA